MPDTWSLPQRQEYLRRLQSASPESMFTLQFQSRVQDLPVHRAPVQLPCYRLANGRTRAAQAEWVATRNLPPGFFDSDPDSAPALEAQEVILKDMVAARNLIGVLRREEQTEPLIMTEDGYVVNGNRRLCAMRLLLEEDPQRYARFGHIRIVILPTCTPMDVRELEARLQVRPETRAEYTWVDKAMAQRDLRNSGMSDAQIAELYEIKDKQIRESVDMLDLAEAYLDARGKTGQYSQVSQNEYAFRQLRKHRRQCGPEWQRDLFTCISHVMIDDPTGGRLYESIPDLYQHLDRVCADLRREVIADGQAAPSESAGEEEDLLGGSPADPECATLLPVVRDPAHAVVIRDVVRDTLQEIDSQERERHDSESCLRLVRDAHTKLQSALNVFDDTTATAGLEEHLSRIQAVIVRIRERLNDQHNG